MNRKLLISLSLLCFFSITKVRATHIVGAELFYECTDSVNSRYTITLKLYRDCLTGQAPFDNQITLFAFSSKSGQPVRYLNIPLPLQTPEIVPEEWDVCVGRPYDICVEEGVYRQTNVYLPPIEGGYDLSWARCCRNQAITNLERPLSEGVTYLAHIPGPELAECNSMPQFNQFPPIFLCAGDTFNFDHSATDADGDSLSYDITNPYTGINIEGLGAGNPREGGNDPIVDRFDNPMGPPPYQNVVFRNGYGYANPFGSRDFNIDPRTGYITATPRQTGIFVISISVFEWRDGNLLSENRRDFQIHVIECQDQDTPPVITHDLGGLPHTNDTIFVEPDVAFCYDISVTDENTADRLTAFPLSAAFGNGFAYPPLATFTFEGTNPLGGEVCWQPACDYAGQVVPLIIGARDIGDCPTISNVFDTVWVRVLRPPNDPPELTVDLTGNTFNNDTLFIQAGQGFCFDFSATDINQSDSLFLFPGSAFGQPGGPTINYNGINPIQGEVCWETSCELIGQVVPLELTVKDNAQCPSQARDDKTIYVVITPPDNDPPTIAHDFSGLDASNDTIFVFTDESFCYSFAVLDIDASDTLTLEPLSPIFGSDSTLSITYSGINPIEGEICWTPSCAFEDAVIPLVLSAYDNGVCSDELRAYDTVYVKVSPQEGLAPVVGFELGDIPTQGDTLVVDAEDSLCFSFFVADLTPNTGLDYDVRFEVLDGTELSLGDPSNIQVGADSVTGDICFKADCANGGSLFRLIVEGIDDKFCEPIPRTTDTLFIKVNSTLQVDVGEDLTVCEGTGGAALEANIVGVPDDGNFTYVWGCDNPDRCGISDINAPNPTVNPSRTTTYFLQVTDPNGCTSEIDSVTLNVLPQPFIDVGANQTICTGDDSVQLEVVVLNDGEVEGPYTYSWFPSESLNDPTSANPKALPDTTTIYSVIVTAESGCTSESTNLDETTTQVVEFLPTPVANAGPDMNVCEGDSITLLGSVLGDAEGVTFTWSLGTQIVGNNVQNLKVSPQQTELYILTVENDGCEGTTDSVLVSYNPAPVLTAENGEYAICANESLTLTVQASVSGDSDASFDWAWAPAEGLSDLNIASPTVSITTSQTFQVTATSEVGCESAMLEVPVLVRATPIAEAGPDAFACGDEPLQLAGSYQFLGDSPDSSLLAFNWTPDAGLSIADILDPEVSLEQSTLYFLTVTHGECSSQDSVLVDLFAGVNADVSADTNLVCAGTEVQLLVLGGNGNPNFTWFPATTLNDPAIATPVATPDTTTTYIVTIDELGCTASDTITIDVRPGPVGELEASATTLCPNTAVDFMAVSSDLEDLVWNFGDGTSSSEAMPSYTYDSPGIYTVSISGRSADGCVGMADEITIEVLEPGIADFATDPESDNTIVAEDLTVNFQDQSSGAISYEWTFGDGDSANVASPTHTFSKEGIYEVVLTITDAAGCVSTDTAFFDLRRQLVFFPNVFTPNSDGVLDKYVSRYAGSEAYTIQIFDRWGKLMFESNDPETGWDGKTPEGRQAEDGVYFYIAEIADEVYKGHITLLR